MLWAIVLFHKLPPYLYSIHLGKGQWKVVVSFFIGTYVHIATVHVHSLKTKVFRIVFNACGWFKIFFCPGGKDRKDNDLFIIAKRKWAQNDGSQSYFLLPPPLPFLHLWYYTLFYSKVAPHPSITRHGFREGVGYL